MTIDEAREIVSLYGEAIAKLKDSNVVQPISDLPCSPAKIKYAFLLLTEHLIATDNLSGKMAENLTGTYAMIDTRFREEADKINEKHQSLFSDKPANETNMDQVQEFRAKYGSISPGLPSVKAQIEFHNFISDCQGNYSVD